MMKNIITYGIIVVLAVAMVYLSISIFSLAWLAMLFIAIGSYALVHLKKITIREFSLIVLSFFILSISYSFYLDPSIRIARGSGTVLSDNWWGALTWMKNNTKECAVVATYWDPGHFITGIANRPVVFDGASQNALLQVPITHMDGLEITSYDNGINHIVMYKNGIKTTARIQDISTTLLTGNETLALDILKEYKKPGCDEMYYIASSDLISKSQWWTYFSTWRPDEKGKRYNYAMIPLYQTRPLPAQKSIAYVYAMSQDQAFVVYETRTNNTVAVEPKYQQGNQYVSVEKIFYFDNGQGFITQYPNAEVKGMLWVDPSKQIVVFIPPELETAIFTRMYFFNGAGLKNFEIVNNWGGEVKLFKVKFNASNNTE